MSALKSWLNRQPVWRQTVISVAALVAVVALSTQVVQTTIGGGSPSGPSSSSFATTPAGMAAYASLIRDAGGTVAQRRIGFSEGTPVSPGATLLLLDVDVLDDSEVFAVRRFLDDGGRVVAGGITGTSWINQVADTGLESEGRVPSCTPEASGSTPRPCRMRPWWLPEPEMYRWWCD